MFKRERVGQLGLGPTRSSNIGLDNDKTTVQNIKEEVDENRSQISDGLMNENDTRDSPSDSSDDDLDLETLYKINEKENLPNEDSITVQQLRSVSMFRVPILIQGVKTFAVVDTAAEVTIISDKLYESLEEKPKIIKEVVMNTAGRDLKMKAHIVFPVRLKLGEKVYEEQIYVAPIEDEMLLGIDFLEKHKADIDICERQLKLDGITLPMQLSSDGTTPKVARVVLNRRTIIPPNSVVKVTGFTKMGNQPYTIEPDKKSKVLIPRTLYEGGTHPVLCLVNVTERNVRIRRNQSVALATEVDILPQKMQEQEMDVKMVETTEDSDEVNVPSHVQDLFAKSSELLEADEKCKLAKLLTDFEDVFAKNDYDLGDFTAIEHEIPTGEAKPIKQRMRRTPTCFVEEEEAYLKKMLDAGVIQPSISEWASAPVLIRKRDGQVRWCVDYRAVNAVTTKEVYPLPLIEECLDTLGGNIWFSKLDANSAYWQVKIKGSDRKKTAFITKYGLFEFVRMAFGLCGAPATYTRVVNLILRGLNWNIVLAFLDDILVLGRNFSDHLLNLRNVLLRFREYRLKLKSRKCELFQQQVEFLGRVVCKDGIAMSKQYTKVVDDWPVPASAKEVERFVGFANYHRSFIKDYAKRASPLYSVTGKRAFQWGQEQEEAFTDLKEALVTTPVLALPNAQDMFILDTDASDFAIGAELCQIQDGRERVIAYGSYALTQEQRNYCTTRKELLSVVRFTRQFRHYLLGRKFVVRTDHNSLTWLLNFKEPQGQLARWLEELSQFYMVVQHRSGSKHANADALSRVQDEKPCTEFKLFVNLQELPCNGCKYCTKAHENWTEFATEVDQAIGLAVPVETTEPSKPVDSEKKCARYVRSVKIDSDSILVGSVYSLSLDGKETHSNESREIEVPDGKAFQAQPGLEGQFGYTLPWDPGGCWDSSDTQSDVVHVDIVTTDKTPEVIVSKPSISFPGYTRKEIREKQNKDSDLQIILAWLEKGEEPEEGTVFSASPASKYYWINKEVFEIVQGTLCKKKRAGQLVLVIPDSLKVEVLKSNHDIPMAGHQGMDRTKERIQQNFYWYRMKKDIQNFVSSCHSCNINKKANKHARFPMRPFHAGAPMERVHLDFLGPLPKTVRGNEYCLVMVDQFTKWVECVPLPSQNAEITAHAAVNEFFSRFGVPFEIFTDQGRNFESILFTSICDLLHIHKARTTPYRPSANGQVERFNRTIMAAVRCFIGKQPNQWDKYLQQISGAIRSSVNRSTGFTPNRLMLGREVNLPSDLMFPGLKKIEKESSIPEYVSELENNIKMAHETARTTLKANQEKMKRDYDLRVFLRTYNVGDPIYVLDTAVTKGKSRKLCPFWKGPCLVLEKLTPALYRVKFRYAILTVNHDRMKPCGDKSLPIWLKRAKDKLQTETHSEQNRQSDKDNTDRPKKPLYCICKKHYDGQFMIQCDECLEWYHGKCVNVTPQEATSIDVYTCPLCTAALSQ